jgi:hypothetical protein
VLLDLIGYMQPHHTTPSNIFLPLSLCLCHVSLSSIASAIATAPQRHPCIPFPFSNTTYPLTYLPTALPIQHTALLQAPEQIGLEELANGDVLSEPLAAARLEDKVAGECLRGRGLERAQRHVLVERVAGDNGPAVEDEGERDLALGVDLARGLAKYLSKGYQRGGG